MEFRGQTENTVGGDARICVLLGCTGDSDPVPPRIWFEISSAAFARNEDPLLERWTGGCDGHTS